MLIFHLVLIWEWSLKFILFIRILKRQFLVKWYFFNLSAVISDKIVWSVYPPPLPIPLLIFAGVGAGLSKCFLVVKIISAQIGDFWQYLCLLPLFNPSCIVQKDFEFTYRFFTFITNLIILIIWALLKVGMNHCNKVLWMVTKDCPNNNYFSDSFVNLFINSITIRITCNSERKLFF